MALLWESLVRPSSSGYSQTVKPPPPSRETARAEGGEEGKRAEKDGGLHCGIEQLRDVRF